MKTLPLLLWVGKVKLRARLDVVNFPDGSVVFPRHRRLKTTFKVLLEFWDGASYQLKRSGRLRAPSQGCAHPFTADESQAKGYIFPVFKTLVDSCGRFSSFGVFCPPIPEIFSASFDVLCAILSFTLPQGVRLVEKDMKSALMQTEAAHRSGLSRDIWLAGTTQRNWSERQDLNLQRPVWKTGALPLSYSRKLLEAPPGLEPRLRESKSLVLPLHQGAEIGGAPISLVRSRCALPFSADTCPINRRASQPPQRRLARFFPAATWRRTIIIRRNMHRHQLPGSRAGSEK